ncbi:MAG: SDR family oxidoreductase [Rhodospirillales bacterium]|nr:SDR family oxidoreductase [Rhodospirillales bacterium]
MTPTPFTRPDWVPRVPPGMRILIAGASGGLGSALVAMLLTGPDCVIGAHGATRAAKAKDRRVIPLKKAFATESDCADLVETFCGKAGGIDALVVLTGAIHFSGHWQDMPAADWERDVQINLNQPFYLARAALARMKAQGTGGRILLTGTESAVHGGSPTSFPYAIAKRGTECMVQGLAREGASHGILVNGLRFGFIASGFHERWHGRTAEDMEKRAALVPLKRGGHADEAAALMVFLLSGWSGFMTGQMIPLTGGDWL